MECILSLTIQGASFRVKCVAASTDDSISNSPSSTAGDIFGADKLHYCIIRGLVIWVIKVTSRCTASRKDT